MRMDSSGCQISLVRNFFELEFGVCMCLYVHGKNDGKLEYCQILVYLAIIWTAQESAWRNEMNAK